METDATKKAVLMLSGGLDSILAARLVKDQGAELFAVNFLTAFCTCTTKNSACLASKKAADNLGVPLKVFDITKEYLDVVKNPKHGYGSNMNPCIDCRIFTFKKAKHYMAEIGASYIVTGEVVDERPMSQRLDTIRLIEKESGLNDLIVRPLSAQILKPSLPEREGWLKREKFLGIRGRGRTPQFALARALGVEDYPCPSGGCLLTYEGFAKKVRDLIKYNQFDIRHVRLLKTGRHFRLSAEVKFIVGRDEKENEKLTTLSGPDDILFDAGSEPGPSGLYVGPADSKDIQKAAAIIAHYLNKEGGINIEYRQGNGAKKQILTTPLTGGELAEYRIN
ncbi:MAG: hypothetical protein ABIH01_00585 [Candidatus Omnitrophota bacterium]